VQIWNVGYESHGVYNYGTDKQLCYTLWLVQVKLCRIYLFSLNNSFKTLTFIQRHLESNNYVCSFADMGIFCTCLLFVIPSVLKKAVHVGISLLWCVSNFEGNNDVCTYSIMAEIGTCLIFINH